MTCNLAQWLEYGSQQDIKVCGVAMINSHCLLDSGNVLDAKGM